LVVEVLAHGVMQVVAALVALGQGLG